MQSKLARRVFKLIKLICHPSAWPYYLPRYKKDDLKRQYRDIRIEINKVKKVNPRVVVLGRSVGGRLTTLLADELGVEKVICAGYPFKHPDHGDEPERYRHLATLNTPTLILQGVDDMYGGVEAALKYEFSANVKMHMVDTNHDFRLIESQWKEICLVIEAFCFGEDYSLPAIKAKELTNQKKERRRLANALFYNSLKTILHRSLL